MDTSQPSTTSTDNMEVSNTDSAALDNMWNTVAAVAPSPDYKSIVTWAQPTLEKHLTMIRDNAKQVSLC
jgi:hypothetical protein